jgi:hypothetical protein
MFAVWALPMFERSRKETRSEYLLAISSVMRDWTCKELKLVALSSNPTCAPLVSGSQAPNKQIGCPRWGHSQFWPHQDSSQLQSLLAANSSLRDNYCLNLRLQARHAWWKWSLYAIAVPRHAKADHTVYPPYTATTVNRRPTENAG